MVARLELLLGDLHDVRVEIHAGEVYVGGLVTQLHDAGVVEVVEPLKGLTWGRRGAWYDSAGTEDRDVDLDVVGVVPAVREDTHDSEALAEVIGRLRDRDRTLSTAELLASDRAELSRPGLYSWWVDEAGARDLTAGLGHEVASGLIYAGLAGATRWPSGKASSNTLWSRLVGMHLGKKARFSTFRLTLGAVLSAQHGWASIDEAALTAWMHEHLRVASMPVGDADTRGALEGEVLEVLDPPLNLKGMTRTPLREELSRLRSQVSGR